MLVDKASYALGVPSGTDRASVDKAAKEHAAFVALLKTMDQPIQELANTLEKPIDAALWKGVKASDLVAFQFSGEQLWPTDDDAVRRAWGEHLAHRFLQETKSECIACGKTKRCLRIAPVPLSLFRKQVPLVSVNELTAFSSCGKTQLANAPLCVECYANAHAVAQYLLELDPDSLVGRHAAVLCRDLSKGSGEQPLRNQLAVFWTNQASPTSAEATDDSMAADEIAKIPFEDLDQPIHKQDDARPGQVRALLQAPFRGSDVPGHMPAMFHLAVVSPAKGRIVLREWLETDVETVRANIAQYARSISVIHPEARGVWWPPLPAMLESLRSFTSSPREGDERPRLPEVSPECIRRLIRCIYTGTGPPEELLVRAVRCYRTSDPPTDNGEQFERQLRRQMAMIAAMKLVLTHDKNEKEQCAMEQLKTEHDAVSEYKRKPPYLTGRMLAVLEMIQQRASSSGRGVNTTLVDKFYASASTAPDTVFGNLIAMATKAHLPKLRREGKEGIRSRSAGEEPLFLGNLLAETCDALDEAGGFPGPLTPREQAQFALGFYHQRADFLFAPKK